MTNRHTLKFSIMAAALLALCLPAMAAAQWRDNRDRDNRDNRDWGRDNRGYGRYDERALRDSVHRLDRLAKDFEKNIDRALDRSRTNGSQREDRINDQVHQFRDAVGDLKSRVGNGRDLNRSSDEARRVLQEGQELDRVARRIDGGMSSQWSQIQRELRFIGDVYGFRYNGGYGRDDDWRRRDRDRDSDRRERDDDYRRRNERIDDWMRRIPFPQ